MIISHELIGNLSADALEDLQQLLLGELISTTLVIMAELHELLASIELHFAGVPAVTQLRNLLAALSVHA